MRLKAGVVSDCGHLRTANEDSFLLRPGLYAVCDGMGGARAGEVASQMACLGLLTVDPASATDEDLRQAVVRTNKAIIHRSASESDLLGMGTTLTAVMVVEDTLLVAHVGDSRAYLLRGGELNQMTADHSWVGEMLRRGEITPAQAARHPHRSVITRALGTDIELNPDVIKTHLKAGDRLLLCSDGLTGMVGDSTIAHIMDLGADAQATAQSLVDAALENGGEDNVTVVVIDVLADDEGEQDDAASWSDSRILVGPSSRARESSPRGGTERLSMAARERLRRRGHAIARPGSRSSVAVTTDAAQAGQGEPAEEETLQADGQRDQKGDEPRPGAEDAAEPAAEVAPPPEGSKRRRKARGAGVARRPKRRKGLLVLVMVLLVLVLAVGGFAWYNSAVYYVGEDEGKVALYRGFPWELWGIEFSSVYRLTDVYYQSLGPYDRERVDSHELVSREQGDKFLDGLSTEF